RYRNVTGVQTCALPIFYVFCLGVVIFSALKVLNLDSTIMTALGAAGILGLGLAFAFQDIAANFISGVVLAFSKPFKVGELVTTKIGRASCRERGHNTEE